MRLYFIRRKSDGMFLRKIEGHYSDHVGQDRNAWSDKPAYILRTPEGVLANLRKLCSTPYYPKLEPGQRFNELQWKDFDPQKLYDLEVVSADIKIIAMDVTPAMDFSQIKAIENVPLTKMERNK